MNMYHIPSVHYRHRIKHLVVELESMEYFGGIAVAVILKSGKNMWLSSTPKVTLRAVRSGLYRADVLLTPDFLKKREVLLPEDFVDLDFVQESVNNLLLKFGLYRGYCVVKSCDDCYIVISINTLIDLHDHKKYYKQTIERVEKFSLKFLESLLEVYIKYLPELGTTRFAQDQKYRHQILTAQRVQDNELPLNKLSHSERLVLYWSAKGKSAEEIAIILGLSKNIVDTYRRRLLEKLNVSNIAQAVYAAITLGYIV